MSAPGARWRLEGRRTCQSETPCRGRSRVRRIAKWTGVVVCGGIGVAWGVSLLWPCCYGYQWRSGSSTALFLQDGRIGVARVDSSVSFPSGFTLANSLTINRGWRLAWIAPISRRTWATVVHGPLWPLLFSIALPTTYLFYRDRRPPLGQCKRCRYDLTGNVSEVCPECGTTI